jgi:hypothetical protein
MVSAANKSIASAANNRKNRQTIHIYLLFDAIESGIELLTRHMQCAGQFHLEYMRSTANKTRKTANISPLRHHRSTLSPQIQATKQNKPTQSTTRERVWRSVVPNCASAPTSDGTLSTDALASFTAATHCSPPLVHIGIVERPVQIELMTIYIMITSNPYRAEFARRRRQPAQQRQRLRHIAIIAFPKSIVSPVIARLYYWIANLFAQVFAVCEIDQRKNEITKETTIFCLPAQSDLR